MHPFKRLFVQTVPVVMTLLAVPAVQAQTADAAVSCTVPAYEGSAFSNVYEAAKSFTADLCDAYKAEIANGSADDDYIASRLKQYFDTSTDALNADQLWQAGDYRPAFTDLQAAMTNISVRSLLLPEFTVQVPSGLGGPTVTQGQFSPLNTSNARFDINENPVCATVAAGMNCEQVFNDFGAAFNTYRSAFEQRFDNTATLRDLSESWDEFLEISKSQTALEVFLTTAANRGHFKADHLVGPPPFQVIALHPDLAFDRIQSEPDGNTGELGLSVEWIGVNYWNKKVPIGVSLASIYVDRVGVRDIGHGIQLHLYNRYAIGWADHDGESSFYFNIDLLHFFQDRKAKYEAYLNQYF